MKTLRIALRPLPDAEGVSEATAILFARLRIMACLYALLIVAIVVAGVVAVVA